MQNKRGLIPTPITDKNGKQTTVYTKPGNSNAASPSFPAPSVKNLHEDNVTYVTDAFFEIDNRNSNRFSAMRLTNKVPRASANDITILAEALKAYPEFNDLIAVSSVNNVQWNSIVSMAVVYDPDLPAGATANSQQFQYVRAIETAHSYLKGDLPDGGWNLGYEDKGIQAKVKRVVAADIIARSGEGVLYYELTMRMLDDNRTDHDEILEVLRANPDATIEQVDFVLSGGSKSLSGGAL